jgi:hypothetical protein
VIRLPRLKSSPWIAAPLLAAIFTSPAARAQTAEPTQIVMPSRVVATQPATLAVLDSFGRLVAKANVTFSDGTPAETDATGRAFFNAPSTPGVLIARLAGHHDIAAASVVLPYTKSDKAQIDWAPALVSIHDRFDVRGSGFRGDAPGDVVHFGGQPALVLAASPAALAILLNPAGAPGTAQLSIAANGPPATATLAALVVEFDTGGTMFAPGVKAALTVRVRGTDQPREMDVENLAPPVLRFAHGDSEHVRTRGGVDNSAQINVRALHAGDFSFRVRLTSADPNSVDVEAAHAYLTAAQKISPHAWTKRLDPILARLERQKPDARKALQDLSHLLASTPPDNVAFLITAARDSLVPR